MTFDPSLRLKDALGVGDEARDQETEVAVGAHGPTGRQPARRPPHLRSADRALLRPDEEARQRILDNRFYDHLSGNLAGILEYMASERLFEVADPGTLRPDRPGHAADPPGARLPRCARAHRQFPRQRRTPDRAQAVVRRRGQAQGHLQARAFSAATSKGSSTAWWASSCCATWPSSSRPSLRSSTGSGNGRLRCRNSCARPRPFRPGLRSRKRTRRRHPVLRAPADRSRVPPRTDHRQSSPPRAAARSRYRERRPTIAGLARAAGPRRRRRTP